MSYIISRSADHASHDEFVICEKTKSAVIYPNVKERSRQNSAYGKLRNACASALCQVISTLYHCFRKTVIFKVYKALRCPYSHNTSYIKLSRNRIFAITSLVINSLGYIYISKCMSIKTQKNLTLKE